MAMCRVSARTMALIASVDGVNRGIWARNRHLVSPLGFAPASRAAQAAAEAHALAVPTPENARAWLRTLTEEPHVAGTPADYKTAVFVRDKLREWGWKADLAEYEVLLNYPAGPSDQLRLELVRPVAQALPLIEDAARRPTRIRPAPPPSPPSTATASRATSPARSSTPTTAGPRTSPRSRRWASTSRTRSSWSATASSSAA